MDEQLKQEQPPQKKPARYTSTLSGSQWSVAKYGIVEFLRVHKYWRIAIAILGIVPIVLVLSAVFGWKPPGTLGGVGLYFLAMTLTPELLWAAAVSGPDFEVVFPTKVAAKERQLAQEKFDVSKAPEDALDLDLKSLTEYYRINQDQARSTFRWAIICILLGFGTIVAGVWIFYFGKYPDSTLASLSLAAGIVSEFISGILIFLHSKTQDRSLYYHQQLAGLQRVAIAIRLAEAHKDPGQEQVARNLLIGELIASSKVVVKPVKATHDRQS
jgi:hypothetical protein